MRVCLSTTYLMWNDTLGGHAWVFLNWALGLQAAGARVVILETAEGAGDPERRLEQLQLLKDRLANLGLHAGIALLGDHPDLDKVTVPLEQVFAETDLFLNFRYDVPQHIVDRFRRSALVDIDPGLLQTWIADGHVVPAVHDMNFTIGETVGQPGAKFPDAGMQWLFSPPPVFLPAWPVAECAEDAAFTTVTNWWGEFELIDGVSINNEKRTNFLACIDLPSMTKARLELAIYHEKGNHSDMPLLEEHGWRTRPAFEVSASASDYRTYLQQSRGEFSCAKESCMVFANAWISDRTLCYLASGKPAVVQHTGPSRFLPDDEGLLRFATQQEAADFLEHLSDERNYKAHAQAARALVEEFFDAEKLMTRLLATAMDQRLRARGG